MNISLRRAAALQNSIQEVLRGIVLDVNVKLNEFQDAERVIQDRQTQLTQALRRRDHLIAAVYQIRGAVGDANYTAGINSRLTEIARLDKSIQDYQNLAAGAPRQASEVIEGQLQKLRASRPEPRMYGYDSTVETTILRPEDIQQYQRQVQELRRQRQRLQDEILELNVRTEISLSPETLETLRDQDLV